MISSRPCAIHKEKRQRLCQSCACRLHQLQDDEAEDEIKKETASCWAKVGVTSPISALPLQAKRQMWSKVNPTFAQKLLNPHPKLYLLNALTCSFCLLLKHDLFIFSQHPPTLDMPSQFLVSSASTAILESYRFSLVPIACS